VLDHRRDWLRLRHIHRMAALDLHDS
jgi:hypothetical protein